VLDQLFTVFNWPGLEKRAMTPAARVAAVIEILTEMQTASDVGTLRRRRAAQWLSAGFQRRRFAGSGDRAAIGDLFWKIQRATARIGWHLASLEAPTIPRNMVLAALVLIERQTAELPQLFSVDIAHAPPPLNPTEKSLVSVLADRNLTHPAMADYVTFEWPEWLMDDTKSVAY
jgi:16S rRNA (cytosine967-C5)-methyltransferase